MFSSEVVLRSMSSVGFLPNMHLVPNRVKPDDFSSSLLEILVVLLGNFVAHTQLQLIPIPQAADLSAVAKDINVSVHI